MDKKLSPKERMAIQRQAMPEQNATERARNFKEVNLGFDEQLALLEADRCIQCKNPKCAEGCPVRVNIPRFIGFVAEGGHRRPPPLRGPRFWALPCGSPAPSCAAIWISRPPRLPS